MVEESRTAEAHPRPVEGPRAGVSRQPFHGFVPWILGVGVRGKQDLLSYEGQSPRAGTTDLHGSDGYSGADMGRSTTGGTRTDDSFLPFVRSGWPEARWILRFLWQARPSLDGESARIRAGTLIASWLMHHGMTFRGAKVAIPSRRESCAF